MLKNAVICNVVLQIFLILFLIIESVKSLKFNNIISNEKILTRDMSIKNNFIILTEPERSPTNSTNLNNHKKFIFDINHPQNPPLIELTQIIKPKKEKRKFYKYTLENGLEYYIIYDKNTNSEGAGMLIKAGAVMDHDVLGLAHFTEHMLFLGSKKYPNATHFVDFTTSRHGKHNGATRVNSTFFYFKIDKDYFQQGFDMFSRFFIDPLIDPKFVDMEVNSVNSEFLKNCQMDSAKKEHVLRRLSKPGSFYNRFRTGNINTLLEYAKNKNLNLTNLVKNYISEYFVPNNMVLVIYGSKNPEFYQNLIHTTFSGLKRKIFKEIKEEVKPFDFFKQGSITFYETLKDHKELEINFLIPEEFYIKKNSNINIPINPALFLKFLFNQKVEGSLYDHLRKSGLITALKSQLKKLIEGHLVFKIHVFLTEKGISNLNNLIMKIMEYINFIKKIAIKDEQFYNMVKKHYDKAFYSSGKSSKAYSFIKMFCKKILEYPDKFILSQHKLLNNYNQEKYYLEKFVGYLTLNNSLIMFGNKFFDNVELYSNYTYFLENFDLNLILKEKENWMNTNYGTYKLKFQNLTANNFSDGVLGKFSLQNFYNLPSLQQSNTTLNSSKICSNKNCRKKVNKDEEDISPKIIYKDLFGEVWHKVIFKIIIFKFL
jgi:insulysin